MYSGVLEPLPFSPSKYLAQCVVTPAVAVDQRNFQSAADATELAQSPANTRNVIEQLLNALVKPDTDSYAVARIIAPLCPVDQHDYRHAASALFLLYFI